MCIGRPPPLRHHRMVIAGKSGRPSIGSGKQTRVIECTAKDMTDVEI